MPVMLPSLRRRRTRAATFLLTTAVLLAACADTAVTAPGDGASGNGPSGSVAPTSVVGSWRYGTISSLSFWDSHTGDYVGTAGGVSVAFTFESNGHYTMQLYVLTRAYNCATQAWTELKGTVTFDGGTFVTHPTSGRYQGADDCIVANNFSRSPTNAELAKEVRTYYWSFQANPNDGKTYLMIARDDPSSPSSFSRAQ